MIQASKEMVIFLPKEMENIPVRVVRNEETEELVVQIVTSSIPEKNELSDKCHVAIWHHGQYDNVPMNEILWLEANGSYCYVHITKSRKYLLSFPLSHIQKALPGAIFIRVQRSFVVNVNQIKSITRNCIIMEENHFIKIGKEYRKEVLGRFVFLGVRNASQGNEEEK